MDLTQTNPVYKNGDYKEYYVADALRVFGFFEEHRFLSNFQMCNVYYGGHPFPSSEHAYMVSKCAEAYEQYADGLLTYDDAHYDDICCMSCGDVKRWGQTVKLRSDWEEVKIDKMYEIVLDKFTRSEPLRNKLLDTGDKILIEANSWGDRFWGFDVKKNKGENNLGVILMKVREILKNDNK
jgi:ribA/ribD-fused uncharacterized protein